MPTSNTASSKVNHQQVSERLSAVEVDVRHLDERIDKLSRDLSHSFENLQNLIERQRQPITAFAGWAVFVLTLVGAVLYPQIQADLRIEKDTLRLEQRLNETQDRLTRYRQVELEHLRELRQRRIDEIERRVFREVEQGPPSQP